MSRVRFATAREVFEAFPAAREDIQSAPSEAPPLAFLKSLVETTTPEDAVVFCAYLLPRREAVWWACQCVRALVPSSGAEEKACLSAAETWVRDPEEHHRRTALQIGLQADRRSAATWAVLAAGWSGGSMIDSAQSVVVLAPPELTAKAARIAVLTALARIGARERIVRLRACVDTGVHLLAPER